MQEYRNHNLCLLSGPTTKSIYIFLVHLLTGDCKQGKKNSQREENNWKSHLKNSELIFPPHLNCCFIALQLRDSQTGTGSWVFLDAFTEVPRNPFYQYLCIFCQNVNLSDILWPKIKSFLILSLCQHSKVQSVKESYLLLNKILTHLFTITQGRTSCNEAKVFGTIS